MKKNLFILLTICVFSVIALLLFADKNIRDDSFIRISYEPERNAFVSLIHGYGEEETVISWKHDDKYWFFFPAYCEGFKIIDECNEDAPCSIDEVSILYSANVPALFIDTVDDNNFLYHNKSNASSGSIRIINSNGKTDYDGELERINGRGNTTWTSDKHPFNIHLKKKTVLLGMGKSKKWVLLSVHKEGTHLNTKLALDIAKAFGLKYTCDSTWVDVYLNDEYIGNYLLTEPISIGDGGIPGYDLEKWNENNNDNLLTAANFEEENYKGYLLENGDMTDGAYIIEKDTFFYYEPEKAGFKTEDGGTFVVKEPEHPSKEQVEFIKGFYDHVSDGMLGGHIDLNAFDLNSLAARGWVEEITSNQDSFYGSMYFYKLQGDDKIYSGPAWDYDRSFGENNSRDSDGKNVDPRVSMFSNAYWYSKLVKDVRFRPIMKKALVNAKPELEEILDKRIDQYAEYIRKSMEMDSIRWTMDERLRDRPGCYSNYDDNVRFIKWFLRERLNYLYDEWSVPHRNKTFKGNGVLHTVSVKKDDEIIFETEVEDGKHFEEELPELSEDYEGWSIEFCEEPFWPCMPILEDTVIYAAMKD